MSIELVFLTPSGVRCVGMKQSKDRENVYETGHDSWLCLPRTYQQGAADESFESEEDRRGSEEDQKFFHPFRASLQTTWSAFAVTTRSSAGCPHPLVQRDHHRLDGHEKRKLPILHARLVQAPRYLLSLAHG